jgi:hypothetical protein
MLVNPYPRVDRAYRKAEKAKLNKRGIQPAKRQWVLCVETTAIEIPLWAQAKAERRLSVAPHRVWFRGRSNGRAKILARQDREAGGNPEITAVEFRLCGRCGRMMLGIEAEARRKVEESHKQGRELPCGSECK